MHGQVDVSCQQYCLNTWKYWCNKNNVDLIILSEPITDVNYMKPTWQRWYIWNILDDNNLIYDKVLLVDVDTMIHWQSPNIFDEIDNEIGVCIDNDNIGWVKKSIDGYAHFFNNKLDWTEYFNCGVILLTHSSKNFCNEIIKFWENNSTKLIELQTTLQKGTDQTPVNYIAKNYNIKFLNKKWNLTHLNRKEILNDFEFINCGYVWHFNGFDKSLRTSIMKKTWENIQEHYKI